MGLRISFSETVRFENLLSNPSSRLVVRPRKTVLIGDLLDRRLHAGAIDGV